MASSKAAWLVWSKMLVLRRVRILDRFESILWERMDELATAISNEHGKTFEDAKGAVARGLEVVEFAVGMPHLLKGEFSENVGCSEDSEFITNQVTTNHLKSYGVDVDFNQILKKFNSMHDDDKYVHRLESLGSEYIEKFVIDHNRKTFAERQKSLVSFPKVLSLLQNLEVAFARHPIVNSTHFRKN